MKIYHHNCESGLTQVSAFHCTSKIKPQRKCTRLKVNVTFHIFHELRAKCIDRAGCSAMHDSAKTGSFLGDAKE